MTMSRKPSRCQTCGERTRDLVLNVVDAPTPALRQAGHAVGIGPFEVWQCSDAAACMRRVLGSR